MKTALTHALSAFTCALALLSAVTAAQAMAINEKGTAGTKTPKATHMVQPATPEAGKVNMNDFQLTKRNGTVVVGDCDGDGRSPACHAINTKGTGSHFRSGAATPAASGKGVQHWGDPHENLNGRHEIVSPRDAASGQATGKTQLPAPAPAAPKTGHVTLNR